MTIVSEDETPFIYLSRTIVIFNVYTPITNGLFSMIYCNYYNTNQEYKTKYYSLKQLANVNKDIEQFYI